ncbi:response regulator transcription factor [Cohnella silvisoli]|uniref:Response regulator n=1 Tax=Cohnella silvisoli TaxID=2873699 RepID=A0ABV1L6E7_9BACL|nr:response regulator [Cohnella silvisoli]MCD9026423.1 response regulator [Cohnella silvisoli]
MNILVVDDQKLERDGIIRLIENNNFRLNVAEAENGVKALNHIRENPVDILITDIRMPFMDGLELSQKAKEIYPNVTIIIYSAYGEFEYARKAIDIHVESYLLKPLKVKEFVNVMTKAVSRLESESPSPRHDAEAEALPLEASRKVTQEVIKLIRKHYMQDIHLDMLAKQVYLTPSYLSQLFKKETGSGIAKFIKTVRLEEARKKLLGTNMRVSEICTSVGYTDLSYFCSLFRNMYGATPAQYREDHHA